MKTRRQWPGWIPRGLAGEEGFSVLEVALVLPVYVLLLVGAADFGKGYSLAIETENAAEAGAVYGSSNVTDTGGMQSAALLDGSDVPGLTATGVHGCECSDGTGASANCVTVPACPGNIVNYVEVDTTAEYVPLFPIPLLSPSFTLRGSSRMRTHY